MIFQIKVTHHLDPALECKLDRFFNALLNSQEKIMATLDDLVTKVSNIGTVEDSVIALLTDISARLKAAGQDQAKLDELSASLDAQTQKLTEAVTANTPSA